MEISRVGASHIQSNQAVSNERVGKGYRFKAVKLSPQELATAGQGMPYPTLAKNAVIKVSKEPQPIRASLPPSPATDKAIKSASQQTWQMGEKPSERPPETNVVLKEYVKVAEIWQNQKKNLLNEMVSTENSYAKSLNRVNSALISINNSFQSSEKNLLKFIQVMDDYNKSKEKELKENGQIYTPLTIDDFIRAKEDYSLALQFSNEMIGVLEKNDLEKYKTIYPRYSAPLGRIALNYEKYMYMADVIKNYTDNDVNLKDDVITPVQRGPRHALFFQEYVKKAPNYDKIKYQSVLDVVQKENSLNNSLMNNIDGSKVDRLLVELSYVKEGVEKDGVSNKLWNKFNEVVDNLDKNQMLL